jgi:5,5'-dehydrodivanillate O-demethylase oxygenase subunit
MKADRGRRNANARAGRFERLTPVSRRTEMGVLLRKFWHPVALSRKLPAGSAMPVRVFGEELTLYRGASGSPYLVAGRCAHRLTKLHTGWIEGEDIRCIYHGWKYDGSGKCVERPAEKDAASCRIAIESYAAHEYAGLIFAYLGDGPAPEFDLPRKDVFETPDMIMYAREETWPCNWLQLVENSMDAVHVSFVHQAGKVGQFGKAVSTAIPELEYEETDAGIRQIATRGTNVRVSNWTFPNYNHIAVPGLASEDPWVEIGIWMVPVDDERTTRFGLWAAPSTNSASDTRLKEYFCEHGVYDAADHHEALFTRGEYPDDPLIQITSAQDYLAAIGQGTVADRANEMLGRSDAGIALLRRLFLRELDAIAAGQPTKRWCRLAEAVKLTSSLSEGQASIQK